MNAQNTKYCKYCGTELSAMATFCKQCGKKLIDIPSTIENNDSSKENKPNIHTTIENPIKEKTSTEEIQSNVISRDTSKTKEASSFLIILDALLLWGAVAGMLKLIPNKTISAIAIIVSAGIGIGILSKYFKKMKTTTNGALLVLLVGIGILIYTLIPHIR